MQPVPPNPRLVITTLGSQSAGIALCAPALQAGGFEPISLDFILMVP